jgi:metal-responsive CopG/Arc/MetJ family transcriptional regulator
MPTIHNESERVSISLPHGLAQEMDELRNELKISRSELFRVAAEQFVEKQRNARLQMAVAEMAEEYSARSELTGLTTLDSEDFA